jgi:hypothetical protein
MSFDEFLEYFDSLTICKINKKLKVKRNLIEVDYDKKYEINAFHLNVEYKTKYYIEINLDDDNRTILSIDLFFVIMSINANNELDKIIEQTEAKHCRTAYLSCELTEGSYLIVPMSFKYWQQRGKILKYNLIIQSVDESLDLKQIKFNSSLLSHIIMKKFLLEKKAYEAKYLIKEIIDSDGDAFIYAIKMFVGETDVTFIMAKNLNKRKHFSVQIEIKPNKFRYKYIKENTTPEVSFEIRELVEELQTTRNNLETRDLVLPLNQRVIAIINHTRNVEKVFEARMVDFKKYECESIFLIETFNIEIIESELIEVTHVNIFSDYLHSNIPVGNNISFENFIEKKK